MFTIDTRPLGPIEGTKPLTDYVLINKETGEWATILPEFGGILRQLVLRKGDIRYTLINSPGSAQALLADETYASALLYPFPSRVFQGIYRFEGLAYALPMNETMRNNALHGFVHGKPFRVVRQETTPSHALLAIVYDYAGDVPGYPFPFSLTVTYVLSAQGLTLAFEALNTGTTRSPAAFGWHPYFTLNNAPTDDLTLTMPIKSVITLDEHMIANGRQPVGDDRLGTFSLNNVELDTPWVAAFSEVDGQKQAKTVLQWPSEGVSLAITQSDSLGYIVVYTPSRRDSIAIEPQTANVNAFNNGEGLTILSPGETLSGEIQLQLS
ncbi:aldose 1-epimerase [Fibrella forsythiae]|uniref:Aldose 1-epimerase n=1 Tax=Fibrella forsythiae TaxID=2817061 RepID=A0ABS3JN93_9BACT|nr:aldose 1-epimerase [Fibrella forsythiae]MBO0950669.1 aldose 1-epimerase [Fibrella forsythiae]